MQYAGKTKKKKKKERKLQKPQLVVELVHWIQLSMD